MAGHGAPSGGTGIALTVIAMAADLVVAPKLSVAATLSEWDPAGAFFHKKLYGAVVSWPIFVLATKNSTLLIVPSGSDAAAVIVIKAGTLKVAPSDGLVRVATGGAVTGKFTALLAIPWTVTTTLPVVAPAGTGTTMVVLFQLVGLPLAPLNEIVLVPCVAPKPVPVTVILVPGSPPFGVSVLITGGTVKVTPLLACPFTVTTTGPVVALAGTGAKMAVALQKVGVVVTPLKVTVLVP